MNGVAFKKGALQCYANTHLLVNFQLILMKNGRAGLSRRRNSGGAVVFFFFVPLSHTPPSVPSPPPWSPVSPGTRRFVDCSTHALRASLRSGGSIPQCRRSGGRRVRGAVRLCRQTAAVHSGRAVEQRHGCAVQRRARTRECAREWRCAWAAQLIECRRSLSARPPLSAVLRSAPQPVEAAPPARRQPQGDVEHSAVR